MSMVETKGPRPYHVATTPVGRMSFPKFTKEDGSSFARTFADRLKAKGYRIDWQPADWTEPKYPGDSIMRVDLVRGDEIGDVRVQWYGNGSKPQENDALKVGSFTPGYETSSPGDTPKYWPDADVWVSDRPAAARALVRFLITAFRAGWSVKRRGQ